MDHVYHRNGRAQFYFDISLNGPYYTAFDHDAVHVTLTKKIEDESQIAQTKYILFNLLVFPKPVGLNCKAKNCEKDKYSNLS